MQDKLSIVSICYNNLEELQLTCQRIDEQTLLPYEHWIIDGSTNDDIKVWLLNNPQPAYRHSIHESDKGISDAFNKGINRCSGDIIHIQNSGDYYYDKGVLELVSHHFQLHPDITWLHGRYAQYRGGIWMLAGLPFERGKLYRGMRTIGHPTVFVRRELYQKYGLFEIDKKIAMDYDFIVRIADEPFGFIHKPLVYFTPGGVSEQKIKAGLAEVRASYIKYIGKDFRLILWGWRIVLLNIFTRTAIGRWWFGRKNRKKKLDQ